MENHHTSTTLHQRRRRAILIVIAVFVVIATITAAAYKMAVSYVYNHPLSDPNRGFAYMEPQVLPAGYHIAAKRLAAYRGESGAVTHKLLGLTAEMNLGTKDWVYGITEVRAAGQHTLTLLTDYNPVSMLVTCIQQTSPQHRTYRLCHWTDHAAISVFEVESIQNGTFIRATFPAATGREIPVQQFGQFVDSFTPADASRLPIVSSSM